MSSNYFFYLQYPSVTFVYPLVDFPTLGSAIYISLWSKVCYKSDTVYNPKYL